MGERWKLVLESLADKHFAPSQLAPYNENPIRHLPGRGRTRNWEDSLQIFDEAHEGGYMP